MNQFGPIDKAKENLNETGDIYVCVFIMIMK